MVHKSSQCNPFQRKTHKFTKEYKIIMIFPEGGGGVRGDEVLFFTIFKAYFVPSHRTTPLRRGGWGAFCFPRGIKPLLSKGE